MTADMRHAALEIMQDADAVALRMAELFIESVNAHPNRHVRIALSGGSTPKRLFAILAEPEMSKKVDWSRVELFFGDERHLPEGHPDRNQTTAENLLISKVPVPKEQVHIMHSGHGGGAVRDAAAYQEHLQSIYGKETLEVGKPLFDLIMLGMGADGHTASLFPETAVLDEKTAWVSTSVPKIAPYARLTLTYPAIASSALIVFLITGKDKAPMLKRLREADATIPSGRITSEGKILILADQAAMES